MESRNQEEYIYGEFTTNEDLETENKTCSLNSSDLKFTIETAENYCRTNSFQDFNVLVERNLKKKLKHYCPKYWAGFINGGVSIGKLTLGVDDWGIIRGIPYIGELPYEDLKDKIKKYLNLYLKNEKNIKINYEEYVEIKFVKLKYHEPEVEKYYLQQHPEFLKYLEKKKEYDEKIRVIREEFENWKIRYSFIQQKLVNLLNNSESRILILDFMRTFVPEEYYPNLEEDRKYVIKLLESEHKFNPLTGDEPREFFVDRKNPYCWAYEWKEYKCKELMLYRPSPSRLLFPELNTPFNLINSVVNMIPYWMANNDNLNLYLIQLVFRFDRLEIDRSVRWSHYNKKWIYSRRILLPNGEPANMPYDM
jgi:hypothetical protein